MISGADPLVVGSDPERGRKIGNWIWAEHREKIMVSQSQAAWRP